MADRRSLHGTLICVYPGSCFAWAGRCTIILLPIPFDLRLWLELGQSALLQIDSYGYSCLTWWWLWLFFIILLLLFVSLLPFPPSGRTESKTKAVGGLCQSQRNKMRIFGRITVRARTWSHFECISKSSPGAVVWTTCHIRTVEHRHCSLCRPKHVVLFCVRLSSFI